MDFSGYVESQAVIRVLVWKEPHFVGDPLRDGKFSSRGAISELGLEFL